MRERPNGDPAERAPLDDLEEAASLRDELGQSVDGSLRAEAEEWEAERSFDALIEVAAVITSNLDLRSLVREILDVALSALHVQRGALFLGGRDHLTPIASVSLEGRELEDAEYASRTVLSDAYEGRSVISGDALEDERLRDIPSVRLRGIRTILCVPLRNRDRVTGVLYLDDSRGPREVPRHVARFIGGFAGIAATAIENAKLHGETLQENARLRRRVETLDAFGRIVTRNRRMLDLLERATTVARVDQPVLLLGESGTGKELLARAIHADSPRALHPFIAHNCAAVPKDLMETLFFGQVRGAFTGAVRDTPGLFRQADSGVLFLDEIGELALGLQAKLLRVLQEGVIRPVGSDREFSVDVRLVAATSRDLTRLVEDGSFREDLFYRLDVLELEIPPLRERADDIPLLVEHFLGRAPADLRQGGKPVRFTPEALEHLVGLPWRGNVRELESFLYRAALFAPSSRVGLDDLEELRGRYARAVDPGPHEPSEAPEEVVPLDEVERRAIENALKRAGGNKSKAARYLGLHRNALLRRMHRLGVEWNDR